MATSLLIIVLALPAFRIGIWGQSEGGIGAMHLLAEIAALSLILIQAWNWRHRQVIFHLFVLLPLALAVWILVTGRDF